MARNTNGNDILNSDHENSDYIKMLVRVKMLITIENNKNKIAYIPQNEGYGNADEHDQKFNKR